MKWIYGSLIILTFSIFECQQKENIKCGGPCSEEAIVKDLSNLDGCGFALELKNGSKLVPQKLTYTQAPDSTQDPSYYFNFKNGQHVKLCYRDVEGVDACMAGKLVFITCIKEIEISISGD